MADAPFSRGAVQAASVIQEPRLRLVVSEKQVGRYASISCISAAVKRPFLSFHASPLILQQGPAGGGCAGSGPAISLFSTSGVLQVGR